MKIRCIACEGGSSMAYILRSTQCSGDTWISGVVPPTLPVVVSFPVHFWIRDWTCHQIWQAITGVCFSMSGFRFLMNERNCVCLRKAGVHRHHLDCGSSPAISEPCHLLDFRASRSCPPLSPCPKPCASVGSQHQHATSSAQSPVHILLGS